VEASEVGGGDNRTVIYGRDTQDTGDEITFFRRVEPADKPEDIMKVLALILVLATGALAQEWRVLARNAQTVIEGYHRFDTHPENNWIRAWIRLTSGGKVIKARVIIDCDDYSHRTSINGSKYSVWHYYNQGELGWSVSRHYCESAGYGEDWQ
jgi:hypothetical protein